MQFKTLLVAAMASSVAVAVSTTTSSASTATGSTCDGQNILDACKASIQGQINSCGPQDYSCLCTQWGNYLTCFASSGCTSDPSISAAQSSRDSYCNTASQFGTTTTLGTAPATTSATKTTTNAADASGSSSGTASGSSSSSTGNAAVSINARGLFALAAAGAVAIL